MKKLLAYAALALFTAACNSDGGSPTDPSQVNIEFTTTDITVGTGPPAAVGNFVSTNYTMWLYNGNGPDSKGAQLDSSLSPGRTPFDLVLGSSGTISGYQQGIIGMRLGGKRRVYVPAHMAYGSSGSGPVPPNAALVFEIDLINLVQ